MVIFAAVGGRMSLIGAVYGTLLVNYGKTIFSESFPELWLLLMGALFISVVMLFPNGLAGIYDKLKAMYISRKRKESTQDKIPILKASSSGKDSNMNPSSTVADQ